jgi:hypothetical protein
MAHAEDLADITIAVPLALSSPGEWLTVS